MLLVIEPVTARLAPALFELILPIQQEEFGIPITAADQPDLADIPGFYRRGAGEFWVARQGDRILGSVALLDIGEGEGALRKMFVHRDWRGGATPLAGRLLDALVNHARRWTLRRIYLGTTEKFQAAHRFYEKNGFVVVAAEGLPARFPRMAVDTRFYCRDLDGTRPG